MAAYDATTMEKAEGEFQLCTELQPRPEGGAKSTTILSDGRIVTGADDRMVTIWGRDQANVHFASNHVCPEHQHSVRALIAIGHNKFATGSLDKMVRIYNSSGELERTLSGHTSGVISLDITASGELISGAWDGTARVWDIHSGTCKAVLAPHENGVSVAALPSGKVVTGSTGRKNEADQHVDYKLRIWESTDSNHSDYRLIHTIEDHAQAVRSVCVVPGIGWASASNDGTTKLRNANGEVETTWHTEQLSYEPKSASVFKVRHLPHTNELATCNEDCTVSVYSLKNRVRVQNISIPGTPWDVAQLPNGDLAVACDQAGTSSIGHIYVFTRDNGRGASGRNDSTLLAAFEKAFEPPSQPTNAGDESDNANQLKSMGHYDQRNSIPGSKEGQYGFFTKQDGSLWACMWSSATGQWTDIGEVQSAAEAAAAASGQSAATSADDKLYDIVRPVKLDDEGGGGRSLMLKFNFDEDPVAVAQRFCNENHISVDMYEKVRDYVIQQRLAAGQPALPSETAINGTQKQRYRHFPVDSYVTFEVFKAESAFAKIIENNGAVAARSHPTEIEMTPADENALQDLKTTVSRTSFYHSSTISQAAINLLSTKLCKWPVPFLAPVLDTVKQLETHEHAATEMASKLKPVQLFSMHVQDPIAPAGLKIIALRGIANAFIKRYLREHALQSCNDIFAALEAAIVADVSSNMSTKLLAAAACVALNLAVACKQSVSKLSDEQKQALLIWFKRAFVSDRVSDATVAFTLARSLGTFLFNDDSLCKTTEANDAVQAVQALQNKFSSDAVLNQTVQDISALSSSS